MKRQKLTLLFLLNLLIISGPVRADQRSELSNLVQAIDFMIDTAKAMQARHQHDASHVRFHYDGLIQQLTITRNRIAAYLNTDLGELRLEPLAPDAETLTDLTHTKD